MHNYSDDIGYIICTQCDTLVLTYFLITRKEQKDDRCIPSKAGVTSGTYLSVSHAWEQVIGQNGCSYCKGMKFWILNFPNKGTHPVDLS